MITEPYTCGQADAAKIHDWLLHRGGLAIWRSVNLSNPGASWTTPLWDADGKETSKPSWQSDNVPERYIRDIADVRVYTAKEVKRFHVAVEQRDLSLKVTSGGSRKLRAAVAKAEQDYGKPAWYEFDYAEYENAVILVEDTAVPLAEWVKQRDLAMAS